MKKHQIIFGLALLLALGSLAGRGDLDPFDILDRIDENMTFDTAYVEMEMEIKIRNRTITKELISYADGNEKSYIEFLSPARDRGTKMLKVGDIIKVYYPSAERIMRLSGHMLRQSMMGSDFSYEDMTERSTEFREKYTGRMLETEVLEGRECYVMELTSREERVTYYRRKIWVDRERFVGLKEELYSQAGKLLKLMTVEKIETINRRQYPTVVVMEDKLRQDSSTTMILKEVKFDIDIPEGTFTDRKLLER